MKKICTIALILAALCTMMYACNDPALGGTSADLSQPYNVACVAAIANNNPCVNLDVIDELASLPGLPGSTYAIINAAGGGQVICNGEIPDFEGRGYSKTMLERIKSSIRQDISAKVGAAVPAAPEVDVAAATVLAVRTIRASAVEGRENVLVYHLSGISTSGLINMITVPVCELDAQASADSLAEALALDMSGIDVVMYCCGDVAGSDQPALSVREQNNLKAFYERLFQNMGADSVTFMDDIPSDGAYSFDETVTVMYTENAGSALKAVLTDSGEITGEDDLEKVFGKGDILSFDTTSIEFMPESTELVDEEKAKDSLRYVIDYMMGHPEFEVLICGTTTSAGEEASCKAFSEKRACTIRDLLAEAGVSRSRVHVLGCGYSSVLYVYDRDAGGELDEDIAPMNRSVKLVAYGSATADQIIDSLR